MVNLINKSDNDWKGWLLGVAILVIAGLASVLSGITIKLISDFRAEFVTETRDHKMINQEQELAIAELRILSTMTYEERIKCLQTVRSREKHNIK